MNSFVLILYATLFGATIGTRSLSQSDALLKDDDEVSQSLVIAANECNYLKIDVAKQFGYEVYIQSISGGCGDDTTSIARLYMEDSCIKSRDGLLDDFGDDVDIDFDFDFNDDSNDNTLYVPPCTGSLFEEQGDEVDLNKSDICKDIFEQAPQDYILPLVANDTTPYDKGNICYPGDSSVAAMFVNNAECDKEITIELLFQRKNYEGATCIEDKDLAIAAIIGIAVGCVVLLACLICCIVKCLCR